MPIPEEAGENFEQFVRVEETFDNGDPKVMAYTKEKLEDAREFVSAMASEDGPEERETETRYSSEFVGNRQVGFEPVEEDEEPDVQTLRF